MIGVRTAALMGALLLLGGCRSTFAPALHDRAPSGAGAVALDEDEQRLWNRATEEQELLNTSSHVVQDSLATAYLSDVAARLLPAALDSSDLSIEVRLIRHPMLNAFAYPDGAIYLHTGLLVRMENEAQLAALLGHEMTHVLHRHALQSIRHSRNQAGLAAALQVVAMPFGLVGALASVMGTIGAQASVAGYVRGMEAEADSLALALMVRAGYDPAEAPRFFEHLLQDVEEQGHDEPFFFGTHPRIRERVESSRRYAAAWADAPGATRADALQPLRAAYWLDTVELDLAAGRYASARRLAVAYLAEQPPSARAHFLLGEALRLQPHAELDAAREAYERAIAIDPDFAPAHRALGLHHYRLDAWDEASAHLARYLRLIPDASDRAYVEHYLDQISRNQSNR